MRKLFLTGWVLAIAVLAFGGSISAQGFSSLLTAIEEIEANLKQLVEAERSDRESQFADLRAEVQRLAEVISAPVTGDEFLDRLSKARQTGCK